MAQTSAVVATTLVTTETKLQMSFGVRGLPLLSTIFVACGATKTRQDTFNLGSPALADAMAYWLSRRTNAAALKKLNLLMANYIQEVRGY